jgi:hypothetical protein
MLPVTSSLPAATSLSVYAGWAGLGSYTVMAINKTAAPINADIAWNGLGSFTSGTAEVLQADSLTDTAVTFNGVANPAPDLSDAPAQPIAGPGNPLNYTFPPYSVTLLRLSAPIDFDFQAYLPLTGR